MLTKQRVAYLQKPGSVVAVWIVQNKIMLATLVGVVACVVLSFLIIRNPGD